MPIGALISERNRDASYVANDRWYRVKMRIKRILFTGAITRKTEDIRVYFAATEKVERSWNFERSARSNPYPSADYHFERAEHHCYIYAYIIRETNPRFVSSRRCSLGKDLTKILKI